MKQTLKSYRDLDVWQKGMEIAKTTYQVTESFPSKEIYGLSNQMRRASVSLSSNIAEGFRRQYSKEFKQFLYIALGSAAELETQVTLSYELKYISLKQHDELLDLNDHLSRMLTNLIKKLP